MFACKEVTNKLHNHIDDEHDNFKKNDENNQNLQESWTTNNSLELKEEIKIEQGLINLQFSYFDPNKRTITTVQKNCI